MQFAEDNLELISYDYDKEPYVETRLLQEKLAMYEGEGSMNVSVLRLPYIFGTMEGKIPLWSMFVDMPVTEGGAATITVNQVGQAAISALENGQHRRTYALATGYISYKDLYQKIIEELGQTEKTILKPMSFEELEEAYKEDQDFTDKQGIEHGIHQVNMLRANSVLFMPSTDVAFDELRVEKEDTEKVIRETLRAANIQK